MNKIVIVLAIVILVLIIILYKYFTSQTSTLVSVANLNKPPAPITTIAEPTNVSYAYGIWVYVNSWNNGAPKTIFSNPGNLKVYLQPSAPTLCVDITMSPGSPQPTTTILVNTNFPLQKWVCIIVSVDNQYVDTYIDGKLLVSQRALVTSSAGSFPPATPPATPSITLGNSSTDNPPTWDAYVATFQRWTAPVNPQTAWSTYTYGNSNSNLVNTLKSYNVDVTVLKNNIQQTQFSLF